MRTFGKVMKAIFGGIFSFLSYIFISLGLWLPAVYSIVYFVACGASGTTLGGKVLVGYFVGLGITAVGGIVIAMLMSKRRKIKEATAQPENEPVKKEKKRKWKETESSASQPAQTQPNQPVQPQYVPYPYPYPYPYPPAHDGVASMPPQSSEPLPPQYNAPVTPPQPDNPTLHSYQPVQTPPPQNSEPEKITETLASYNSVDATETKTDGRVKVDESNDERPMVFRTRRDPNVFVCEYHDRFQYWRRTRSGMILERTEYKGMSDTFDGRRRR